MKKTILLLLLVLGFQVQAQLSTEKADSIISQLSLEEKVYLVVGTGMDIPGFSEESNAPQSIVGETQNKIPGAAGTSYPNKKAGFPAVVFADGPAGIRISPTRPDASDQTFYATAFPTAISLASTWNVALVREVGRAFGNEGKEYGIDFLLAPALNIHRNPLGGRNFEYYSEDPVLSGKIAAGFVNGVQEEGIGATIKHFVANNSETNRTELNTVVSERALREIYLKGFEIAIEESNPWALMSSYNKINGVYASENENLLTKLLRDEWHFKGFVMTDWFAGKDPVAQMIAGNDLLMPGTNAQSKRILEAVRSGELDEKILDRNITHILKQYIKTPSFNNYIPSGKPDLKAHKSLARKAAAEGMVLLKNDAALPVTKAAKVALFGVTSYETIAGGTGSGDVNKAYSVSLFEGLQNAGFLVDKNLSANYETYITNEKLKIPEKKFFFEKDLLVPEKTWTEEALKVLAETNDVAVFTLGRTSGEFQDREVEGDFKLTQVELNLIQNLHAVFKANNKKLIVVLNIGGVIETAGWKDYADGILLAWQPGQEAGKAIADIISGAVNPSGKLTISFPFNLKDVPSSANFPGKILDPNTPKPTNPLFGVPSQEVYEEGIYIGYRYFDTFKVATSYPFGFGSSYTKFDFKNLNLTRNDSIITITCEITNSGDISGKEVVQLYVTAPLGEVEKPTQELKGFTKTGLLAAGETQEVSISVDLKHLGYFDTITHSWKLDQGEYKFIIASDSQTPELTVEIPLEAKILSVNQPLLIPTRPIKELQRN